MLRVLVTRREDLRRAVAMASTDMRVFSSTTFSPMRCLWMRSSNPGEISMNIVKTNHHSQSGVVPNKIQRRNYIFLPASLSDASKLLKNLFDNILPISSRERERRLMVKLQNRWQDTLFTFQRRMDLLKNIQRKQRKLARQRAHAARSSIMKGSAKYSLFVKSIHGKVGNISSIAISRGKRNLLSHYNAKKRVYARRKIMRQLARKISGSGILMNTLKSKYVQGENGWGWMGSKALINKSSTSNNTWRGITLKEPTQQSWFDSEGYPLTSRDSETGRFVNPWLSESSNGESGLKKFLRWKLGGAWCRLLDGAGIASDREECEKVCQKTNGKYPYASNLLMRQGIGKASQASGYQSEKLFRSSTSYSQSKQETISLTWIGHSSTVVTFPGEFTVLTDPHFSNYAGPVRRTAPPALGVADLPEVVDCVLISHDHMDHLDYWSVLDLIESNKVKFWVVPLGIKLWLMDQAGVSPEDIVELEWWEGVKISKLPKNTNNAEMMLPEVEGLVRPFDKDTSTCDDGGVQSTYGLSGKNQLVITCAPAQHWCSRTPFDRNRRLWCSFAVHATPAMSQPTPRTHSFYFAGDTGLPPEFPLHQQIGDRLGPFDLAAIPIGAYEPNWFMRASHCNPAEAVKIHQAVRSRKSVAIHFDTFDLADEPREEPPLLLLDEVGRINEDIIKTTSEVAAVANEVGIATGTEKIEGHFEKYDTLKDEGAPSSPVDKGALDRPNDQLIDMLPPLVDFQVVKQGQVIEIDSE
mmetsp:Transcript_39890/g.96000  ORF Transcript_39890/g.96000 Transcript_39890/m.96000 type:complete len:752 (+) Transcript_39890:207-2462(+)